MGTFPVGFGGMLSAVQRGGIGFVRVALGTGAGLTCARCSSVESHTFESQEIIAALDRAFAAWTHGPGPNVELGGFEPFSHPDLPRIIAAAAEMGFERIRLLTDGGALAFAGNTEGCISMGVRLVELALLGGTARVQDSLSGRPGLYDSAMRGAEAFLVAGRQAVGGVALTGRAVICRHNAETLPQIVAALVDAGAIAIRVECRSGGEPSRAAYRAADIAATTAGVALFGDGVARSWGDSAPEHWVVTQ